MKPKKENIKRNKFLAAIEWLIIFVLSFLLVVVIFSGTEGRNPSLFGFRVSVVMSKSMEPELKIDDIVFSSPVKKDDDINIGDTVLFFTDKMIVHEVIMKEKDVNGNFVYTTKGTANNAPDSKALIIDDIEGKVIGKIGKAGEIIRYLKSNLGIMAVSLIIFVFIAARLLIYILENRGGKYEKTN